MTNPVVSDTNPWFPYAYPASYTAPFNQRTLSQENLLATVARLNSDVRRNFYALQLFVWETYGLKMGVGTGWRVQPANKPGHAAPGNSWHEGIPVEAKVNAFAIDTVGCDANGVPCHGDVWTLQERHGPQFGFVSFLYLDDRPHIQSLYIPRSRSFRNAISQLPTYPLPHQPIDQRYDVDYFDIDNPLAAADGPPVVVEPPVIVDPPPVYPSDPPLTGGTYTVDATRSNVQLGSQGKMVRRAQFACQLITGGPALVDGDFGPATDAAIRNFQHFFKLTVDGQVGPKTWTVLEQITND